MMQHNQLGDLLAGYAGVGVFVLLILLVVFLILREFWCWYWKINQMVRLLREVRDLLAGKSTGSAAAKETRAAGQEW